MLEQKFEDRRIFDRVCATLPVRILSRERDRDENGQLCDVCAKGLGLVTQSCLKAQDTLELWLYLPDTAEPLYLRGEVAWSLKGDTDSYRIGVNLGKADFMGLGRVLRLQKEG